MQTVRTMTAGRRAAAAIAVRAAIVAGCAVFCLRAAIPTSRSPALPTCRPTIACVIRSRCRKPNTRWNSSSVPIAANSTRRSVPRFFHSGSAGSAKRPAALSSSGRSAAATSMRRPTPCARSNRFSQRAACRRKTSWYAPIRRMGRPGRGTPQLSENRRTSRTLRRLARDIGPSLNRNYFENQPTGISAAPTNAISPPWSTIRPISCNRAANSSPRSAAYPVLEKYVAGQSPATQEPISTAAAKLSDVGK